ncbi:amidohydrolase [Metabacillus halosaccharovorans]|uniref:amidohydrolase n=1 Tax=Metabacillus halosaccharovorans TaxID=930124 RepID=UPI0020407667|nr:amidohydrolase [Metabacillus halosaccharovorans]MCM3439330.1 amidohydrolase [Metabacillus halosaccharovorans]
MKKLTESELIIRDCSILTADFDIKHKQSIVIKDSTILAVDDASLIDEAYQSMSSIDGKGKLFMPGFVDAHMHTCQQLLRGRIADEYPMIWTRIMVPFESNLREEDVHISAQLSSLDMIKSGTTAFVDAGGTFMHKVAETAIQSGLRGTITCSTMNSGNQIPENMKSTEAELLKRNTQLYNEFHGLGDGRLNVWFSLRSIISCTPSLITKVFEKAKELNTGVQSHMNEYPNEISFCLENFQKRPFEFLESLGVLDSNFLSAHSILLSENEIDIIKNFDVKVAHCPISNAGKGIPKTPNLLQKGITVGIGTDGAAHSGLSVFDEMKTFKSLMRAFWGTPIFDPMVMPAKKLLELATLGGAKAMLQDDHFGTIEVGKKADLIGINIDQPHIQPTHNLVNSLVESVNSTDVSDMIVNGQVIMKNREVLTLDEEKIMFESNLAMESMSLRAGI